jgi:PKD repeat protein
MSVSITGTDTALQGCPFTLTMHASGFTPSAIDWAFGSLYDNQTSATFTISDVGNYTITVVATTPGGGSRQAAHNVQVIPPPPTGC